MGAGVRGVACSAATVRTVVEDGRTGTSRSNVGWLQREQNRAARLISRTKRSDHTTPVLRTLHWILVHQRIVFSTITQVYTVLHNPKYPNISQGYDQEVHPHQVTGV